MRKVVFSPHALRQFRALRAYDRARLKDVLVDRLEKSDATLETRNRFRLRRPSLEAHYELRCDDLRVFYRVSEETVRVVLIGQKVGEALIVDGKRFTL